MRYEPASWIPTALGEIHTARKESPSLEDLALGAVSVVSKIGFGDGKIQLREDTKTKTGMILVRPGDLLVSGINAAKGAIAIYDEDNSAPIAATIHYGSYIPDKNRVDVRFLWWLLRSRVFRDILNENLPGGIKTELKAKRLLPIKVPLPLLDEQRRIVSRIEELAAKIEKASGLRRETMEVTEGLLAAAMKSCFDFTGVNESVGSFASVLGGYAFPSSQYVENGSHQIVRIGNVRDGYLDLSRAPVGWDLRDDKRIEKYELRERDIVISMTGTRNKRDYGYVAIVPPGRRLLLNQRVGKIVPRKPIERRYLFYFLRSPFFRDNLFPRATGTANQANIGNKYIEEVPFDPPSSIEEQRRVVRYLDDLQAKVAVLKQLQTETSAELDALLPSILSKAFRGEL